MLIFYHCSGDPDKPKIVMGHGWPTSSYDWKELVAILQPDYYICSVDYPGHGFSEKPRDSLYKYSMFEHADVIDKMVTEQAKLTEFVYLTHDEGDSVGLQFLANYQQEKKPYTITHHILLNGSIYLPEASLTTMQYLLLNKYIGPIIEKIIPTSLFAYGLGRKTFNPPLNSTMTDELATVFDFDDGVGVFHGTI